ncbi:MAG: hypothetical protein WAM66_12755 [Acidobacteriaceae bacterium]
MTALAASARLPVFRVNTYGAEAGGATVDTQAIRKRPRRVSTRAVLQKVQLTFRKAPAGVDLQNRESK